MQPAPVAVRELAPVRVLTRPGASRRVPASLAGHINRDVRTAGPGTRRDAMAVRLRAVAAVGAVMAAAAIPGCSGDQGAARTAASVRGARIGTPSAGEPGEWTMPAKDYAGSRYSALDDITPENASRLTWRGRSPPACCRVTRVHRSWSAPRCTSSRRIPTSRTRSISRGRAPRCSGSTGPRTRRRRSARRAATS